MKKSKQRKIRRQIIEEERANVYGHDDAGPPPKPSELSQKPKKKSPCPCGSGKKFSECCRAKWDDSRNFLPGAVAMFVEEQRRLAAAKKGK